MPSVPKYSKYCEISIMKKIKKVLILFLRWLSHIKVIQCQGFKVGTPTKTIKIN